jgi:Arc/MetJ-type ribon-helix-helix transcriptional regulator
MATRTLTLELPAEIAEELEARVAAGLAQSTEDAIVDAVERTRELGLEHWVRTEGAARYDRVRAGEPTMSAEEMLRRIHQRGQARLPDRG